MFEAFGALPEQALLNHEKPNRTQSAWFDTVPAVGSVKLQPELNQYNRFDSQFPLVDGREEWHTPLNQKKLNLPQSCWFSMRPAEGLVKLHALLYQYRLLLPHIVELLGRERKQAPLNQYSCREMQLLWFVGRSL
jgi:hypothetical protein